MTRTECKTETLKAVLDGSPWAATLPTDVLRLVGVGGVKPHVTEKQ